jgi:hypothetical protein
MNITPRTLYSTNGAPQSASSVALDNPFPILFHDNSNITFHDGSHIAFHNFYQADVDHDFSTPRTVYSGEVDL